MGKGLVQNPTETSWRKGMEGGDSKVSAHLAGSPEEHPQGADRKVPPPWGAGPERKWLGEAQSSLRPEGRAQEK